MVVDGTAKRGEDFVSSNAGIIRFDDQQLSSNVEVAIVYYQYIVNIVYKT